MSLEEKRLKVFISGPMSGYEDYNRPAFFKAEKLLTILGYSVFNPAWLAVDDTWTSEQLLDIDFTALRYCDYIYQLPGWKSSIGANKEWKYATQMGIKGLVLTEGSNFAKILDHEFRAFCKDRDASYDCTNLLDFPIYHDYINKEKVLGNYLIKETEK